MITSEKHAFHAVYSKFMPLFVDSQNYAEQVVAETILQHFFNVFTGLIVKNYSEI